MADPVALALNEAMIRTLAEYFDQDLPVALKAESDPVGHIAHVTSGWEHIGHDMRYPTVSIDAPIEGDRVSSAPVAIVIVESSPTAPIVEVYYHVADVEIPLTLNVFAESKVQRSLVVHALEVALQGDVLDGAGALQLDSSYYYGLPFGYRREGPFRSIDSETTVGGDEWRAVGTLLVESHEIARVQIARFLDLSIDWRVAEMTKVDQVPGEIVTYFEP